MGRLFRLTWLNRGEREAFTISMYKTRYTQDKYIYTDIKHMNSNRAEAWHSWIHT